MERQEQLIAAAEAMRTWVHAQRATWSEGYPKAFPEPSLTPIVSVAAAAIPAALPSVPDDVPMSEPGLVDRSDAVVERSAGLRSATGLIAPAIARGAGFVRRSWQMAVLAVVLVAAAWILPSYWSGVKDTVSADLATRRRAVGVRGQAITERATAQVAKITAGQPEPAATFERRLQVESSPPGAQVLVDGRDRGVTPLTLDDLSVGPHKVVIRTAEGSVQRTISMEKTGVVELNEAIFSGWVHVSSPVEVQISEGRQVLHLDDRSQVLLAPGSHEIRLENRTLGLQETRRIDVRPGETTSIVLAPPLSRLSVNAPDGSTVAVDGEAVGPAPLVDHPVALGTRDVTVTSPSGDVRRQTITVTVQPVRVDVDFSQR